MDYLVENNDLDKEHLKLFEELKGDPAEIYELFRTHKDLQAKPDVKRSIYSLADDGNHLLNHYYNKPDSIKAVKL